MSHLSVWPDEVEIEFEDQVVVLDELLQADIPIAHLCGGKARCSTCRVRVMSGADNLEPRNKAEAVMAERLDFPDVVRLACQTVVSGSVRLGRLVLDSTDVELTSQLSRSASHSSAGREVDVAVLFADIVGYTAMSDDLPVYDVVHLINRFFTRATHLVEDNGGRVDNYIGDSVFAVFGVEGKPDPAASAVRTALGLIDIADDLSQYFQLIYGKEFAVRVGVHFGGVIFGTLGAASSARDTVIGDTVNVASRLEAANKETGTKILVSEVIKEKTDEWAVYGRQFELDVRGKQGLTTAFELLGVGEA